MVSAEDVRHLAELARLSVSDDSLPKLVEEFDGILAYVGQLNELTITNSSTPTVPLLHNVFREDVSPTPAGKNTDKIVKAFPKKKGNALSVKQILSHEESK